MKKLYYHIGVLLFLSLSSFYLSLFFVNIDLEERPESTFLFDKSWIYIWDYVTEKDWVSFRKLSLPASEYPKFAKDTIITIEDKSFYSNAWIDIVWIVRAAYNNISWKPIQWATTISSWVIRNLKYPHVKRTYKQKVEEFYFAMALNAQFSKDEILALYLNNIYFWFNNYSLEAASYYYFWKSSINLTKWEILTLLTIPKNASKFNPYNKAPYHRKRFEALADLLYREWVLSTSEKDLILEEQIVLEEYNEEDLPYIIDFYKNNYTWKTWRIDTTTDYYLTSKLDDIAFNTILNLKENKVWNYGIVILDRENNSFLAWIWWKNYYADETWEVSMITALRQPWSTLKPFIYLLWFRDLDLTPADTILDLPVSFTDIHGNSYTPQNYNMDYKWEVTISEALSESLNVPAVKMINKVWPSKTLELLRDLWFDSLDKDVTHYWLSLALGSWEVSLWNLVTWYSVFYNDWQICNIALTSWEESSCVDYFDVRYVRMVQDILMNRYAKIWSFPINSNLDFSDRSVFVKTWTSRNFKDNWTIWYTDNYAIWVWAWNKNWEPMVWVSWVSWAWEIFKKIVYFLEDNESYYISNNYETTKKDFLEITSPLPWTIFKINPEKSLKDQEINLDFETNVEYDGASWFFNEEEHFWETFRLKPWNFEVWVKLYDSWEIVKEKFINIYVK